MGLLRGRQVKEITMEKKISWIKRKSTQEKIKKATIYSLLIAGGIIILVPFFWMVSTSLKIPGREFIYPPQWIPRPVNWSNYPEGWTLFPFTRWLGNTLFITIFSIVGQVASVSLVAYSFARLRYPGRNILFLVCLATMMLPRQVTMIPVFILFRHLRWIDTFKPLIVPFYFAVGAFFIFLMRQFYLTIPTELEDAARIDGCNTFGIFLRIMLPLSRPALGIVAVFSFMGHWNDFMGPLIYLSSTEKFTLALGLRLFQGQFYVSWTRLMAVSILILLPCIAIFFIAQKYYIQGIVITGIKE